MAEFKKNINKGVITIILCGLGFIVVGLLLWTMPRHMSDVAIGIISVLFGLAAIIAAIINRRYNKKAYQLLYQYYPELKQNFSLMKQQAIYCDSNLEVSIYKKHLLLMKTGLRCFELSQIDKISIEIGGVPKNQMYGFIVSILAVDERTGDEKVKTYSVNQSKYNKKIDTSIEAFFQFITTHYPHIGLPTAIEEKRE